MTANVIKTKIMSFSLIGLLLSQSCFASADGITFTSGQGTVEQTDALTTQINITSQDASLNFDSLNLNTSERLVFNVLSSDSKIHNTIGGGLSVINGQILSPGIILLYNPAGFHFGSTADIQVGSLIVTTHVLSAADFFKGSYQFTGSDAGNGLITNDGRLTAMDKGFVVLVADSIQNTGVIQANFGTVALAAGKAVSFEITGDGLLNLAINEETAKQIVDDQGNTIKNQIHNNGLLEANGGKILISAKAADSLFEKSINLEGITRANRIQEGADGQIHIVADGDIVAPSGSLEIQGRLEIHSDKNVILNNRIQSDASILKVLASENIGLDRQALIEAPQSVISLSSLRKTVMMPGSQILAPGSEVRVNQPSTMGFKGVYADVATIFYQGSTIDTTGGLTDGFIEASGAYLDVDASTLRASEILFDPLNITFSNAADANTTGFSPPADVIHAFSDAAGLTANFKVDGTGVLASVNAGQTISFQATNNITIVDTFDTSVATGDTNVSVNLIADNTIAVNAGLSTTGTGTITLTGTNGITISAPVSTSNTTITLNSNGDITLNSASADVSTGGASLTVNADQDNNGVGAVLLTDAGASLSSGSGRFFITAADMTILGSIISTNTVASSINVSQLNREISIGDNVVGSMNISGAEFQNISTPALSIGNANNGNIYVDNVSAANAANVGRLNLTAAGTTNKDIVFQNNAASFNQLDVAATGDIQVLTNLTTLTGSLALTSDANSDSVGSDLLITAPVSSATAYNLIGTNANIQNTVAASTNFSINMTNNVNLSSATASLTAVSGSSTVNADSDFNGSGTITMVAGSTILNTGTSTALRAADMALGGASITSAGSVSLQNSNSDRPISLGAETVGSLSLTDAELDIISAPSTLSIGRQGSGLQPSGDITIAGAISPAGVTTVNLLTGGGITQQAGAAITETTMSFFADDAISLDHDNQIGTIQQASIVNAGEAFSLNNASGITVRRIAVNNADITVTTDNGNISSLSAAVATEVDAGTGSILYSAGGTNSQIAINAAANLAGSGGITYKADNISLSSSSTSNAGSGILSLENQTAGTLINLGGADAAGTLGLTSTEINTLTAGVLRIGSSTAGNLSVSSAIAPTGTSILSLITGGGMTQTASITETNLRLSSVSNIVLLSTNDVDNLAAVTSGAGSDICFNDVDDLNISTVNTITGITTNNGDIALQTGASLTQSAGAVLNAGTGGLLLRSAGAITLNEANILATLAVDSTGAGNAFVFNGGIYALGTVTCGALSETGITTNNGDVCLTFSGDYIQTAGELIDAGTAGLGIMSSGSVALTQDNTYGSIAANLTGAGKSFTITGEPDPIVIGSACGIDGITTNNGVVNIDSGTSITATQAISSGSGDVTLTADDGITLSGSNADITTTGTYTVDADNDNDKTGTYSQDDAGSAVSAGGDILIEGADLNLVGTIAAGSNNVTIRPSNDACSIGVEDASKDFKVEDTELDNITTTGTVIIGSTANTGGIFIGTDAPVSQNKNLQFIDNNDININGALSTTSGGTLTFTSASDVNSLAAGDINSDGAVLFNGAGNACLMGDITTTNDNIDFNQSITLCGNTVLNAGSAQVNFNSGTFDTAGFTNTITGLARLNGATYLASTGTQTFNSGLEINSGTFDGDAGTIDINEDLTINGGTFEASSSNTTVSGDWNHAGGTFTHNSGTVILDGTLQKVYGDNTFNNFTKTTLVADTLTFEDGVTQTILGTTTLQGTAGNLLSLRSCNPGSVWMIDPQGTRDISFVDVEDSVNLSLPIINPLNSVDTGNNTDWFSAPVLTGGGSTIPNIDRITRALNPTYANNGFLSIGNTTDAPFVLWENLHLDDSISNENILDINSLWFDGALPWRFLRGRYLWLQWHYIIDPLYKSL